MDVVIVGAGMGGLSAAAVLSAKGVDVTVLEASAMAGGKVGVETRGVVEFDTGPSLLTMPGILDEILAEAGASLQEELTLRRLDPEFAYHFPDGSCIEIAEDVDATLASVEEGLGERASEELSEFLDYARDIWNVAGPSFILSESPSWRTVVDMGWGALSSLRSIDPLSTMESAITSRIQSEKLQNILRRFATYVGSDPRQAPATLNCIAWLEIGNGGYGVEGGMFELTRCLQRVAERNGAEFRFGEPVRELTFRGTRVTGVKTDSEDIAADYVISNVDVGHLNQQLLPESARRRGPELSDELSMSGWTALVKANRRMEHERPGHQVLFPEDYHREFVDIFERDRPPESPAVYLCAQEKAHGRSGWSDHEPMFVMANAPPEPAGESRDPSVWKALRERVLDRAVEAGLLSESDEIVWERTPTDLAERYPGTRGALYGASSNSTMAAFNRPANEPDAFEGLALCGGSVHPGGGVPLCLQSGRLAANLALES